METAHASPAGDRLFAMPLALDDDALAALLNDGCVCSSVDHGRLARALAGELPGLVDAKGGVVHTELRQSHPHLFSDTIVFVAMPHLRFMAQLIEAVERLVALPAWQERALAYAPAIAAKPAREAGVFLGYDFHLGAGGPQLIEINTNAGGGLLNAKLLHAQSACCGQPHALPAASVEARFMAMFREEWSLVRGAAPLKRIAIVDESPATQFLAPEFELFRQLFEANGVSAQIVAPNELVFDAATRTLRHGGEVIDLVYNRLTDFALADAGNAALRAAWLADAVVLTPHPRAHALYADKRNLVLLSDDAGLANIGVSATDRRIFAAGVPRTLEVRPDNADRFWATRKNWFFKPAAGYGSKAAYRGDKLTRGVFAQIAQGAYVAQALVVPSERRLLVDGAEQKLKVDLRNYAYRGAVQLVSARLYQGQTTNFRTRGGGFAAVLPVSVGDAPAAGEFACAQRETCSVAPQYCANLTLR